MENFPVWAWFAIFVPVIAYFSWCIGCVYYPFYVKDCGYNPDPFVTDGMIEARQKKHGTHKATNEYRARLNKEYNEKREREKAEEKAKLEASQKVIHQQNV